MAAPLASWLGAGAVSDGLIALAGLAWAGAVVATLAMAAEARDSLARAAPRARRWWWAAVAVALLVRLVVPFDLVRVFTGWDLLGRAFAGAPLPRYGAGFVALLRPLLWIDADPERWITGINLGVGVASVAGLSLAAWRWRPRPLVLPATAWVLALLPVWVRHHRSESALVVAFAAWLVGVAAYGRWLRTGRRRYAWLALGPLLAAAYTRPAFVFAGPAAIAALHRWLPGRRTRLARRSRPVWVALLWLLLPQLLWLALGGQCRAAHGDLPATRSLWFLVQLPLMLVVMNLALWPHAFPLALSAVGLRGAWAAWRGRRSEGDGAAEWPLVAATGAVGAALLVAGMADPVVVSLPRLQAPWLGIWAVVCVRLALSGSGPQAAATRRWLGPAVAVTALATVPWLFRPENADHEDRGLREAAERLKHQRGTLHWLAPGDRGGDKVSRHYPTWRFRAPNARLKLAPLRDVPTPADTSLKNSNRNNRRGESRGRSGTQERSDGEGRWVWLGVRCYARHRERGVPAPATFEQPACARVRGFLEPVFERRVPNHGDVHFPWWPSAPELTIGLYRVPAPAPDGPGKRTRGGGP